MFKVYLDGIAVGTADLVRTGLYYSIQCRCSFPDARRYRVYAVGRNGRMDLGLCVPVQGGFGFRTRVMVKKLDEKYIAFEAVLDDSSFFPIDERQPFIKLSQIRSGEFCVCNGIKGIRFPIQGQPGSDRNP